MSQELPVVLNNFNRRKALHGALMLCRGAAYICGGLLLLGLLVRRAQDRILQDRAR